MTRAQIKNVAARHGFEMTGYEAGVYTFELNNLVLVADDGGWMLDVYGPDCLTCTCFSGSTVAELRAALKGLDD